MNANVLYEAANLLVAEGAPGAAVTMLRGAWRPDWPLHDRVRLYDVWIRALSKAGQHTRAMAMAARALDEHPGNGTLVVAHARAARAAGRRRQAERILAAAHAHGADANVALALAESYLAGGRPRRAIHVAAPLVQDEALDPALRASAARTCGRALQVRGRLEEAVERFDLALELAPFDVAALVDRSVCLADLGETDSACAGFERAVSLDPEAPSIHFNYAIALHHAGRTDAALAHLERAHGLAPDEPLCCAALGRLRESLEGPLDPRASRLLHAAIHLLAERAGSVDKDYGRIVVEEVFDAFATDERWEEARWVLQVAADHGFWSPRLLERLQTHGEGGSDHLVPFWVVVRVVSKAPPLRWPRGVCGYTADLAVVAATADEARTHTLSFVRSLEGEVPLEVNVEVLSPQDAAESGRRLRVDPTVTRRSGVADVLGRRTYLRE